MRAALLAALPLLALTLAACQTGRPSDRVIPAAIGVIGTLRAVEDSAITIGGAVRDLRDLASPAEEASP